MVYLTVELPNKNCKNIHYYIQPSLLHSPHRTRLTKSARLMFKHAMLSSSNNFVALLSVFLEFSHASKMVNVLITASLEFCVMSRTEDVSMSRNTPSWNCSVDDTFSCASFMRNFVSINTRKTSTLVVVGTMYCHCCLNNKKMIGKQ